MKNGKRLLAALALATVTGSHGVAVRAAGNDQLSVPDQYFSIQSAVDAATPGDTIHVAAGVYNENIVVRTPDLRLHGARGAVIDGAGLVGIGIYIAGTSLQPVSGVEIDGFEVRDFEQGIVVEFATDVRIHRNDVHHNVEKVAPFFAGTDAVGIDLRTATFSEISQNAVHDNENSGIQLRIGSTQDIVRGNWVERNGSLLAATWGGKGIFVTGPSNDNMILENKILDNIGWGILLTRPPGQALTGMLVAQNRIHGNGRAGIALMGNGVSGNTILRNNATGNSVAGFAQAPCFPFDLFDQFKLNTWGANHGIANF